MKAAWFEKIGAAEDVIKVGERETPKPGPGEVRVKVATSGVNPSDVKTRAGARGPLLFPFIVPHSDGAGVVDAVGQGVDSARVGERVWIWNGAWKRQFGTCAEHICVPDAQAPVLPSGVAFDAGACLGIPAATACYGVFCDGAVDGQTVLVTGGAGAVGRYAVQLAKWGGAQVIATVSSDEKAAHAEAAGADHIVNYKVGNTSEAILDAAGGKNIDRIVEVEFGGNLAVSNQVLAPGGVIATYGSMGDPTPSLPFYEMMFNTTTIKPFLIYLIEGAARTRITDLVNRALTDGALSHVVAATYALEGAVAAHQRVESGDVVGNVVITV
ncbi:MAG: NADPH:quinone reductase [Pseudomonadota bacterium]